MGADRIRYLVFVCDRWRWRPTRTMRAAGFRLINLSKGIIVDGENVPTVDDKNRAIELNEAWDRHRRGLEPAAPKPKYPTGTLGDAYLQAIAVREAGRRNNGITWTKEQHSRDDWPRAWRWIEPLFGDVDPKTVTWEQLFDPDLPGLRPLVAAKVSETEAHRVTKVWRRLWQYAATFKMCDADLDPSFVLPNSAPPPRQDVWLEAEARKLVKQAWRSGYHGLTALLAVAWDSQLSPVDARTLKASQRRSDAEGTWFETGGGPRQAERRWRPSPGALCAFWTPTSPSWAPSRSAPRPSSATGPAHPTPRTPWATTSAPYAPWCSGPARSASCRTSAAAARWRR